jgi:hypothetical protein
MKSSDWRACLVPRVLLEEVRPGASERKLRLLLCGALRQVWQRLPDPRCREAVELAERVADGQATPAERQALWLRLEQARGEAAARHAEDLALWFRDARNTLAEDMGQPLLPAEVSGRVLCELFRDLFTPHFNPALDPDWLKWNGATLLKMARVLYDERRFADLPLLGDALEEAGCRDLEILSHCRAPKALHTRGCWVLDALLGKE